MIERRQPEPARPEPARASFMVVAAIVAALIVAAVILAVALLASAGSVPVASPGKYSPPPGGGQPRGELSNRGLHDLAAPPCCSAGLG